ncbi:MAG: hypothetical protein ACRD2I_16150 [Vicinamibacterales bacterium]
MDGGIELAANVGASHGSAVHAAADEATCELVHDDEHPVGQCAARTLAPIVIRLSRTVRRARSGRCGENFSTMCFWNASDLERKLAEFQAYYNAARGHASLEGDTPLAFPTRHTMVPADLSTLCAGSLTAGSSSNLQLAPDKEFETDRLIVPAWMPSNSWLKLFAFLTKSEPRSLAS